MKSIFLRSFAFFLFFSSCGTSDSLPTASLPLLTGDLVDVVPASRFNTDYPDWKNSGAWQSVVATETGLDLIWENGQRLKLEIGAGPVLRLRWALKTLEDPDESYAVVSKWNPAEMKKVTEGETVSLEAQTLKVEASAAQQIIRVFFRGELIDQFSLPENAGGSNRFRLLAKGRDDSHWYGLGEKAEGLRLNGGQFHFWNSDTYGYKRGTDPIYSTVPFAINAKTGFFTGYFLDNTAQTYFFLGNEKGGPWSLGALGGELDLYLFPGITAEDLVQGYTDLTGRAELVPQWALGYQQSRYSYTDEEEVMAIAEVLREKRLPSDVIYLDIDYMDQNKSFTVNRDAFPDLKAMLGKLREMGFKIITILDPGIAREEGYFVFDQLMANKNYIISSPGVPMTADVWPGECIFPDFTRETARVWWGGLYSELLDWGVAGFWNDMNEPAAFNTDLKTIPFESFFYDFGRNSPHALVHNVYGLQMARATWEGLKILRPQNRAFVLSRAGYSGLQRYAAQWTGDNVSNWDHLALNLTMGLNMGVSGIAFNGADVGGYVGSPDPELFTRWMQLGALYPLYRNHTGKDTEMQEPWNFGDEALVASRKALELRYKLLPLFYSLLRENTLTGAPLTRPLFWDYSNDPMTFSIEDQLMIGENLMAAPVLVSGQRMRKVYFPLGYVWFDWYSGREFVGGRTYEVEAPLDKILLFVRGGGIVPTGEVTQFVGEKDRNLHEIRFYPGGNGKAKVYWDDGLSMNYLNGAYLETEATFASSGRNMRINWNALNTPRAFNPPEFILLRVYNVRRPTQVLLDGRSIPVQGDSSGVVESDRTAAWYENDNTLLIKLFQPSKSQELVLLYP